MSSEIGGIVAMMGVKQSMQAHWQDDDPQDKGPSRLARAAGALRRRFASFVQQAHAASERGNAAADPVMTGD
jgi:hypothetical protein